MEDKGIRYLLRTGRSGQIPVRLQFYNPGFEEPQQVYHQAECRRFEQAAYRFLNALLQFREGG